MDRIDLLPPHTLDDLDDLDLLKPPPPPDDNVGLERGETMARRCADIGAKGKAATLPIKGRNGESDDGGGMAVVVAATTTTTTTTIAESDNGGEDGILPRRILRLRCFLSGQRQQQQGRMTMR
jgi:hypothetical protein